MFSLKMYSKSLFFVLLFVSSSADNYIESNGNEDYFGFDNHDTLEHSGGPALLSPASQKIIKGFEPIYISPEMEDILDQQSHDVFHEEVHGTVLMPRISFGLNDDDQPIREEDYGDYVNLVEGVDPKFYGRGQHKGRGEGGDCGGVASKGGVNIFKNPMHNPTIEEMIPFGKIKESRDTFIVMADDPVLAVDSIPKCKKGSGGAEGGSEGGGEATEGATEGGDQSTEGESGSVSTEGSTEASSTEGGERRKRSVLYE